MDCPGLLSYGVSIDGSRPESPVPVPPGLCGALPGPCFQHAESGTSGQGSALGSHSSLASHVPRYVAQWMTLAHNPMLQAAQFHQGPSTATEGEDQELRSWSGSGHVAMPALGVDIGIQDRTEGHPMSSLCEPHPHPQYWLPPARLPLRLFPFLFHQHDLYLGELLTPRADTTEMTWRPRLRSLFLLITRGGQSKETKRRLQGPGQCSSGLGHCAARCPLCVRLHSDPTHRLWGPGNR